MSDSELLPQFCPFVANLRRIVRLTLMTAAAESASELKVVRDVAVTPTDLECNLALQLPMAVTVLLT